MSSEYIPETNARSMEEMQERMIEAALEVAARSHRNLTLVDEIEHFLRNDCPLSQECVGKLTCDQLRVIGEKYRTIYNRCHKEPLESAGICRPRSSTDADSGCVMSEDPATGRNLGGTFPGAISVG